MARADMIYTDDAGVQWIARNLDAGLLSSDLGFDPYSVAAHSNLNELPAGFRMRRVNASYREATSGKVRRRSFPCGKNSADAYVGAALIVATGSGLDASGAFVDNLTMTFTPTSTTGELRPMISTTDPGYVSLVFDEDIIVTPTT